MPALSVTIRPCEENDLSAVYAIELDSSASPWSFRSLSVELSYPFSRMYVAEHRGEIVGFSASWNIIDEIQLNNIAVKAPYRRRGIATALLNHLTQDHEGERLLRVILEVRAKNTSARKFYRSLGFRETGERKNYYGDDDAILMEREL